MVLGLATWELASLLIFFLVFFFTGGISLYIWLDRLKYPYKVMMIADNDGKGNYTFVKAGIADRARLIPFGDGGEQIYYLKKRKRYRVAYRKFVAHNTLLWIIAADGLWYNAVLENFDRKLLQLGVRPTHLDARYSNAAVRKGLQHRYDDRTFIEKWAVPITIGMLIIAILVNGGTMYFVFTKITQNAATNLEAAKVQQQTLDLLQKLLSNIDNIKSGGSGLTPVNR